MPNLLIVLDLKYDTLPKATLSIIIHTIAADLNRCLTSHKGITTVSMPDQGAVCAER